MSDTREKVRKVLGSYGILVDEEGVTSISSKISSGHALMEDLVALIGTVMKEEPRWCDHIPGRNKILDDGMYYWDAGKNWENRNPTEHFRIPHHIYKFWKFCPECGAKRPE